MGTITLSSYIVYIGSNDNSSKPSEFGGSEKPGEPNGPKGPEKPGGPNGPKGPEKYIPTKLGSEKHSLSEVDEEGPEKKKIALTDDTQKFKYNQDRLNKMKMHKDRRDEMNKLIKSSSDKLKEDLDKLKESKDAKIRDEAADVQLNPELDPKDKKLELKKVLSAKNPTTKEFLRNKSLANKEHMNKAFIIQDIAEDSEEKYGDTYEKGQLEKDCKVAIADPHILENRSNRVRNNIRNAMRNDNNKP